MVDKPKMPAKENPKPPVKGNPRLIGTEKRKEHLGARGHNRRPSDPRERGVER